MATRKTRRRSPVIPILFFSPIILLFVLLIDLIIWGVTSKDISSPDSDTNSDSQLGLTMPDTSINLQSIVDDWVSSTGGEKSVLIYDLDNDTMSASYNSSESYNIASLYKLFVVYEGYRRIDSGEWNADDAAGYTGYTISKCLDLAIRESNSICAETLWYKIGQEELDEIIENDFGITNSTISAIVSNPEDILKIMQRYYEHPELSQNSWESIQDSMLNQPVTTYDWRRGLPSGFSDNVKVYNKVGWAWGDGQWDVYHDAAFVEFPEKNRHYIVIVMTKNVTNQKIAELGSLIEAEIDKY